VYSLEMIEQMNRKSSKKARKDKKEPFLITSEDQILTMPPFPFPDLGRHVPKGWKDTGDRLFCDSFGIGDPDEPALTVTQLKAVLEVGKAYAIVEQGQFQLYLGIFEKE